MDLDPVLMTPVSGLVASAIMTPVGSLVHLPRGTGHLGLAKRLSMGEVVNA